MPHYLGLDSSTQSLTAIVVDTDNGEIVFTEAVRFGQDLPSYASPNGFLTSRDPSIRHANPLMWVEALDILFSRMRGNGYDLGRVRGVAGAGQQHGSVYLKRPLREVTRWTPGSSLRRQVQPLLSRVTAPIWMDSSTAKQCDEIARAVGGEAELVRITGSRATPRFTGPQIRKYCQEEPEAYAETREIHLVSSFMASLLVAGTAPIDAGDGAGMNLLDLEALDWSASVLDATAPTLREKLPKVVRSQTVVGHVAEYFSERYGFRPDVPVLAFTGDNPSSLVGMGAIRPGVAVISLGTSDTVFAAMAEPRTDPRGYGHVFGNPAGGFMSLICFANGSLAREEIATRFGLGWDEFGRAILERSAPGNAGNFMLPLFVPEITPRISTPRAELFGSDAFRAHGDPAALARAVVEAQAMSMRLHSDWIGQRPELVLVTGGASTNPAILQVLADVFQAEMKPLSVANSSALGAALRAAAHGDQRPWNELFEVFSVPDHSRATRPDPATRAVYDDLSARFAERLHAAANK